MAEKTFVLAGGPGERLRPLTDVRSKPDLYLCTKRILEYVLDIFANSDIYDINIAVQYESRKLKEYFGDGTNFLYGYGDEKTPLKIRYMEPHVNKEFVGTADALRKSRPFLADNVVVRTKAKREETKVTQDEYLKNFSNYVVRALDEAFDNIIVAPGDIITDLNLDEFVNYHNQRGGIASIALYRTRPEEIVNNYGMVKLGKHNKIVEFLEKPKRIEDVTSDIVNAGIYVFNRKFLSILSDREDWIDFGKHVFRDLIRSEDVFGYEISGYWNDVGTIPNYRDTNLQLIDGIEGIDKSSHIQRRQENSSICGTAKHSIFAQGCYVAPTSVIEDCILGNDVYIGDKARLEKCILLPSSWVEGGVSGKEWILDRGAKVYGGAEIGDGAIIGRETIIKPGACIHPGVRIGPGEVIGGEVKEDILSERL